jgi:hypothetical protein
MFSAVYWCKEFKYTEYGFTQSRWLRAVRMIKLITSYDVNLTIVKELYLIPLDVIIINPHYY